MGFLKNFSTTAFQTQGAITYLVSSEQMLKLVLKRAVLFETLQVDSAEQKSKDNSIFVKHSENLQVTFVKASTYYSLKYNLCLTKHFNLL